MNNGKSNSPTDEHHSTVIVIICYDNILYIFLKIRTKNPKSGMFEEIVMFTSLDITQRIHVLKHDMVSHKCVQFS